MSHDRLANMIAMMIITSVKPPMIANILIILFPLIDTPVYWYV